MYHFMRSDGGDVMQSEAIKLRRISNTSSALDRLDFGLGDTLKALVKYNQMLFFEYRAMVIHTDVGDTVDRILPV